ncbi:MAG: uracil-DNA glycosylase, partial [Bacteroidales bacterium]|nr:uracil-DNA glycosylase [Bacteroidales bacterium]
MENNLAKIIDETMSLQDNFLKLNQQIRTCTRCKLSQTRKNALPGEGSIYTKLMIVAQSPGIVEDLENRMFVGPSGKIFNELIENSGVCREKVYMNNMIKCMLPNSRRPSNDEILQCTVYLNKEIELIQPKSIVPLGFHATRYIFRKYDIPRPPKKEYHNLFGREFIAGENRIFPLRHPTALFFNSDKREVMMKNYK